MGHPSCLYIQIYFDQFLNQEKIKLYKLTVLIQDNKFPISVMIKTNQLSNVGTVTALLNGMIGGIILLLPVLAIRTGYVLIPILSIIFAFASFYTAWINIRHLENRSSMDQVIRQHFDNKPIYPSLYNLIMSISMTAFLLLYYDFLCQQVQGLFGLYSPNSGLGQLLQFLLPTFVTFILFLLVIVAHRYDVGAKLLSIGVVSIFTYIIFIFWVLISKPDRYYDSNHKQGIQSTIPAADTQFVRMAAHLGMGYAIHNFMIPILKRNKQVKNYTRYVGICYILGFLIYTFIAYSSFGIVNRAYPPDQHETIKEYFRNSQDKAVRMIEILFSVHLISVFPQFLIIAKCRVFGIFDKNKIISSSKDIQQPYSQEAVDEKQKKQPQQKSQSQKELNQNKKNKILNQLKRKQYIFYGLFLFFACVLKVSGFKTIIIMEFNGAVICFLYVYVIPILLHFKCVFFTQRMSEENKGLNSQSQKDQKEISMKSNRDKISDVNCGDVIHHCKIIYSSAWHKWGETILLLVILLIGALTMGYSLAKIFNLVN